MAKSTAIVSSKPALIALLEKDGLKNSLADVLPNHLKPERFIKLVMVAFSKTPKLYGCTQISVMESLMKAAELGLDCTGTLGQGYLIPYGEECTFQIGYQGMLDLARRSNQIKSINCQLVYNSDIFDVVMGSNPEIIHKPNLDGGREDKDIIFVYGVADMMNGSKQIEWMTIKDVEKIRQCSKMANGPAWKGHYGEMVRKTMLRRLCKYLPLTPELTFAMSDYDEHYGLVEVSDKPVTMGTAALENKLTKATDDHSDGSLGESATGQKVENGSSAGPVADNQEKLPWD